MDELEEYRGYLVEAERWLAWHTQEAADAMHRTSVLRARVRRLEENLTTERAS